MLHWRRMNIPGQDVKAPGFRALILGLVAAALIFGLFVFLPETVKFVGAPFLFIPEKLGLIEHVSREEIQRVSLLEANPTVRIEKPGRYTVYSGDSNLQLAKESAMVPWLKVQIQSSGEMIPVYFVERGLRAYDSPLVRGRPLFVIEAPESGIYQISAGLGDDGAQTVGFFGLFSRLGDAPGMISVVPDTTSGKEGIITRFFFIEVGLIAGPPGFICFRKYGRDRRSKKTIQIEKRRQSEDFWKS